MSTRRRTLVLAFALGVAAAQQNAAPAPIEPAELPADWAQRDLEGKWVAFRAATGAADGDPRGKTAWVLALAAAGETELLEWIAVFEGWRQAGPQLARLDAPPLMRAAAWNLAAFDSHDKDNAEKAMRDRGAVALGWFVAHPVAQRGKGAAIFAELEAGFVPADASRYLPPLDPMQVLVPWLEVPGELAEFGERRTAEPRVRYVHQVLRALDGVVVHGDAGELVVAKVLALCRRADRKVAVAAFQTLGRLPPDRVPWRGLVRLADDAGLDDTVRSLATTTFTYSAHPEAFFAAHRIASDPAHAGRVAAIGRLGEIGDGTTLALLQRLEAQELVAETAHALRRAAAALEQKRRDRWIYQSVPLRTLLRRLAWLRATQDPRAEEHFRAAHALLTALNKRGGLEPALDQVLNTRVTTSPFEPGLAARVEDEVRKVAIELRPR